MDLSRPETWRARFSLALPHNPHLVPDARAPRIRALWGPYVPPPPQPERTPRAIKEDARFRLARRFEALRRVLENPHPHAARLARALAAATLRWRRAAERYWWTGAHSTVRDSQDPRLSIEARCASSRAPEAFLDSS